MTPFSGELEIVRKDGPSRAAGQRARLPRLLAKVTGGAVTRVVLALATICVAGCALAGPGRGELHAAAHSLLPPHADVVEEVEGDCVELAPSPSCVHLAFTSKLSLTERTAAVREAARGAGWTERRARASRR
jgi:hypothetical protein